MIDFSFLLPTRGRPELVKRLFQSIVATTTHLDRLEIILSVDDDDLESQALTDDRLHLKRVVLPRGAMMGELNHRAYEQSVGRYIMPVNDDLILRTPGWDEQIREAFRLFPDDIALIHVNDLLFKERLCTFPMVSRRACEAIGFCERGYNRYRIDDHIYDVYNLLAYLGHKRLVYLPDVVFEHENYATEGEQAENTYVAEDNKVYVANKEIMAKDAALFDSKMEERKQAAMRLAGIIDAERLQRLQERHQSRLPHYQPDHNVSAYRGLLEGVTDPHSYRRPDFTWKRPTPHADPHRRRRTTVAVVTANLKSDYATECIDRIKRYTTDYDLLILDNSNAPNFNHPRVMNRAMRAVETDFLVLMDDDVYVEEGWLEAMLGCMDDSTGVVVPIHKDLSGQINYAGLYLAGDGTGAHAHHTDAPAAPQDVQSLCTAILLIDMRKCGHIQMQEVYAKYFFDLAYGLEVWEAGYRVVCTPETAVTHLNGATMIRGTELATALWERDSRLFIHEWIATGRFDRLAQQHLRFSPAVRPTVEIPERIRQFATDAPILDAAEFVSQLDVLMTAAQPYPLFFQAIAVMVCDVRPVVERQGRKDLVHHCNEFLLSLPKQVTKDAAYTHPQMYGQLQMAEMEVVLHEAWALWERGERAQAIALLEKPMPGGVTTVDTVKALAQMLFETEQFNRCLPHYTTLTRLHPDDAHTYSRMGHALFQVGNLDAAERAFCKALALDPNAFECHNDLAVLYFQRRRVDACLDHLRHAMRINPDYPDAHLNFALVMEANGDPVKAAACLGAYLQRHPDAEIERQWNRLRQDAARAVA